MKFWTSDISTIASAIDGLLRDSSHWPSRFEVLNYVDKCIAKGFCITSDDMRNCASRYLNGKRKITPPGFAKRKKQEKERKQLKANVPAELLVIVNTVISQNEKAISQYKSGNDKAINALMGQVLKQYKADATFIKELIIDSIK